MKPRHFWYLLETVGPEKEAKRGMDKATRKRLLAMIEEHNGRTRS
jgi:hypothetical protein